MPRLKIALVCDWYAPRLGGIETQLQDLAAALAARGHEPHVITATPGAPDDGGPIRVHRLTVPLLPGWQVVRDHRALDALHFLLARHGFDVVHGHSLYSPLAHAAMRLARDIAVPSLLTSHSFVDRAFMLGLRALAPEWSGWPDRLSAVGSGAVEQLRRLTGRSDVAWLPNGIDLGRFAAPPRPARLPVTVLSVLRLHRRKRPLALVRALPTMLRHLRAAGLGRETVRLELAGDGPLAPVVARLAQALGVADRLRLHGAVPRARIPALLAAADVFVLPSRNEAFGIAALEARAAGLPVVAMRAGGAADLVEHGQQGLLAEDDDELGRHLATLVSDEVLRRRLGQAAARHLGRYAWPAIAARHEAVYAQLMAARAPRRSPRRAA